MRVRSAVLSVALLAAACSEPEAAKPVAQAAASLPAVAAPSAPPPPTLPPAMVEPVETALTEVRAFNAGVEVQLMAIGQSEAKYAPAARRALAAARANDVAGAKKPLDEANAARKANQDLRVALDTQAVALAAKLATATAACTNTPELAGYPGCSALATEQAAMTTNLDVVGKRLDAAEATWTQLRPGLDEATATVVLGR